MKQKVGISFMYKVKKIYWKEASKATEKLSQMIFAK